MLFSIWDVTARFFILVIWAREANFLPLINLFATLNICSSRHQSQLVLPTVRHATLVDVDDIWNGDAEGDRVHVWKAWYGTVGVSVWICWHEGSCLLVWLSFPAWIMTCHSSVYLLLPHNQYLTNLMRNHERFVVYQWICGPMNSSPIIITLALTLLALTLALSNHELLSFRWQVHWCKLKSWIALYPRHHRTLACYTIWNGLLEIWLSCYSCFYPSTFWKIFAYLRDAEVLFRAEFFENGWIVFFCMSSIEHDAKFSGTIANIRVTITGLLG